MVHAFGQSGKNGHRQLGGKQLYPVGAMDHSAALSAIKATGADWIYVTGYTQDLILARKQMSDLGVKAPIITMVAAPAPTNRSVSAGPVALGVTRSRRWH